MVAATSRLRWSILPSILLASLLSAGEASAQRQQYKIEADGTVLMLKRVNVTTFTYVPHGKAELRTSPQGKSLWYFKAPNGKEYTAPAPDQPAAPQRYTAAQLSGAFAAAQTRGEIPAALKVEQDDRGASVFVVKFVKNDLGLRWHAQVGMTAEEYEAVDKALRRQGYTRLFAEVYLNSERATRFVAAWRR